MECATLMGTSLSSGLLTLGSWAVGRGFLLGSPWAGEEEEPCAVLCCGGFLCPVSHCRCASTFSHDLSHPCGVGLTLVTFGIKAVWGWLQDTP